MSARPVYTYENARGKIIFRKDSGYWIAGMTGDETESTLTTTQSTGQIGESVSAVTIRSKKLTITGSVTGDADKMREKILAIILPNEKSVLTVANAGEKWSIEGYAEKTPSFQGGAYHQSFRFSFYAPYPYWRAPRVTHELAGLIALWRTPFFMTGARKISEFTENVFKPIKNDGSAPMPFRVVFHAAQKVVKPALHNADKNTVIRINKTLEKGERFEISTHDADKDAGNAVLFYGTEAAPVNGFRFIAPGSDLDMRVQPGGNTFVVKAVGGLENLRCVIVAAGGERHSL